MSDEKFEPSLFDGVHFSGVTYEKEHDYVRLNGQIKRVYEIMLDRAWHTLQEIEQECLDRYDKYDSQAGISARLRDLRKERFGSHTVERRARGDRKKGLWEYRLEK